MPIPDENITKPTDAGWYLARMKTWPGDAGYAPVKVTRVDSSTLQVWQCADERPWPVEAWEWRCRFWP